MVDRAIRYYVAYDDPDDFPIIEDGPYKTREEAETILDGKAFQSDYVILFGHFIIQDERPLHHKRHRDD